MLLFTKTAVVSYFAPNGKFDCMCRIIDYENPKYGKLRQPGAPQVKSE